MSAQNAKDAADEIVARMTVSASDKDRKFQLVTFTTEEDCRFFYPRRSLDWQRQVNTYVSRALRERFRIRVQRIAVTEQDFREWFTRMKMRPEFDNADVRRKFADQYLKFLA